MKISDARVLLPQPIEAEAVKLLADNRIRIIRASNPGPETVGPLMKDAEAIVLRTGIKITKELIDLSENLWTISRTGGGVDNVDIDAAAGKGILVTSSLGVNATTVVEHCLALITALFKQLILMDREVRNENFRVRYKNLPRDLRGKCLGVVGFGRIGSQLAGACNEIFNMRILANDAYLDEKKKKSSARG